VGFSELVCTMIAIFACISLDHVKRLWLLSELLNSHNIFKNIFVCSYFLFFFSDKE
jgi:hypothetical protein